jgi:peptidyl-prolyl cis-trans isomerase A (cyclophilin A)
MLSREQNGGCEQERHARTLPWFAVCRRIALICSFAAVLTGAASARPAGPPAALLHPTKLTARAPRTFTATFKTSKGSFVVTVHRAWSPRGADRFYNLVRNHFYDAQKVFRVVRHFVVQFGISPYPQVSAAWANADIRDDPAAGHHNLRGTIAFASAGPNTRTTQVFVNTGDNVQLDGYGFTPFGAVTAGMKTVDSLYGGYGDRPTSDQAEMAQRGNAYLEQRWPKLDTIESATVAVP